MSNHLRGLIHSTFCNQRRKRKEGNKGVWKKRDVGKGEQEGRERKIEKKKKWKRLRENKRQ